MNPARILIVDDQAAMLRSVERILGEYLVRSSTSSKEAVALAKAFKPHLAIVDIRMPEMDGFELMNALKRQDENIQVILMTGSVYDVDEQLIRAIREKAFYYINKPFDREVLRTLVQRCVEHQTLQEINRKHLEHLEHQLAEARIFQETMLPAKEAILEGVEIHAAYRPCVELAGDLYDYVAVGEGRVALLIADVVGHGVSAAMLTGLVKSAFRSSHVEQYHPLNVVERVAEAIAAFRANRFVTLLCLRISVPEQTIEYVNAGHDGGLILTPDRTCVPLKPTGPLISPLSRHLEWKQETMTYLPKSLVLLYTDGISEASDEDDWFGVDRIGSIVQNNPTGGTELLNAILGEVEAFSTKRRAADDMTLLTARYV